MKKNKTLLFMTFLVWLVGSLLTGPLTSLAAASEQADIRKVRVGYFEFPKYHELQEKGAGAFDSGTGYGCDFLSLLRRYAKLNYEFVGYDKSWQDMLDMLRRGEIDMVTSATKNEERLKEFAFSEPIGKSMAIISVKKDDQRYHYSD
ncbi:MAG: transporter substrate-binding domain-containing protein, partial [Phascolarctobacterium sp.]